MKSKRNMEDQPVDPALSGRESLRSTEAEVAANLERLTFTGIDALCQPADAYEICKRYPKVELGILVGGHNGQAGYNRYPDLAIVEIWKNISERDGIRMAVHLCGEIAREAMGGPDQDAVLRLCQGFGRVQVNAPEYDYDAVKSFADKVACPKVILQKRDDFSGGLPLEHPKVEWLFDLSGGTGHESLEAWPKPHSSETRAGYAGGLSPGNIGRALEFIRGIPEHAVWVDMESGVRTDQDWLDFGRVEGVCRVAFASNGASAYAGL